MTDAIAAARLEQPLPADPERAEFMRRLDAHEDILARLYASAGEPGASRGALFEEFRMSRRAVVALYDHARLTRTETTHG